VLREEYYRHLTDFNDEELVASWKRQVIECTMLVDDSTMRVVILAFTLDMTDFLQVQFYYEYIEDE
ncbi:unnamed protein product, partial [Symbiodinium pilosum]